MTENILRIGQKRISKFEFPDVGKYVVEIVSMDGNRSIVRFTATEWDDRHWVENVRTSNQTLLEDYLVIDG